MKIQRRKANFVPFRRTRGGVEVYLSQRSKIAKQFPDMWSFWGGGIEEGESPEQAMRREVKEELVVPIASELKKIMESVYQLDVPLIVDVKYGQNWQEMALLS